MAVPAAFLPFGMVQTTSTTDAWVPITGWGFAAEIKEVRATMEMRAMFGNGLTVVPAFQTSNDKITQDTPLAIPISGGVAGRATTEKVYTADTSNLAMTQGKEFVRFGWLIKSASGLSGAAVGGKVSLIKNS